MMRIATKRLGRLLIPCIGVALLACASTGRQGPRGLEQIEHVVVMYLENRSFDHLFGTFPGANGLANAGAAGVQVDEAGQPYATLPPPLDLRSKPTAPYARITEPLPNGPFALDRYYRPDQQLGSLIHAYYQQQAQINGGRMNRFAQVSDSKGYAMGYWDGSRLMLWEYARRYTLADNFFHAAFGGSFLNHLWLVCACTPVYPNAPGRIVARLDASGAMVSDGAVTPDGFGVNTMEPVGGPHGPLADPAYLLPVQTMATIGDRLSEKGVDWAWYSGGWAEAEAGTAPEGTFSYHHQPFAFFARFQKGNPARARHQGLDFRPIEPLQVLPGRLIDRGTLPAVALPPAAGREPQRPSPLGLLGARQRSCSGSGAIDAGRRAGG